MKQTALLFSPIYREQKKHLKKGAKIESLHFFWAGPPSCLVDLFSFACQIKLSCNRAVTPSCNTGLSITSKFCCGKTEPRKLHIPLTSLFSWLISLVFLFTLLYSDLEEGFSFSTSHSDIFRGLFL